MSPKYSLTAQYRLARDTKDLTKGLTAGSRALVWFLVGYSYRISLKSTLWLWWPLAFFSAGFRASLDLRNSSSEENVRARASSTTNSALWRVAIPLIAIASIAWALPAYVPVSDTLIHLLPSSANGFLAYMKEKSVSPTVGIRSGLTLMAAVLALLVWWRADHTLYSAWKKVTETPQKYENLRNPQHKAQFLRLARQLEFLRLLFVLTAVLCGEAWAFWLFVQKHPEIARAAFGDQFISFI